MLSGLIEILSTHFAIGWTRLLGQNSSHVYASLRGRVIGWALADIERDDLNRALQQEAENNVAEAMARGFIIVFSSPVSSDDLDEVEVTVLENSTKLPRGERIQNDKRQPLQLFILGSPRSGTSEMGKTLTTELQLRWVGEGHAAPSFAKAAAALSGFDATAGSPITDFMRQNELGAVAEQAMRKAYYWVHGSPSFVDKTPGVEMIRVAPFLARCFPEARFIFMRRNGIANVLSRMAKFGGSFEDHCSDWAASMHAWQEVKVHLQNYIEVDQEAMLEQPEAVAVQIAQFLGLPTAADAIGLSLRGGSLERTGAGIGRVTLDSTGWDDEQIYSFIKNCGSTMVANGYGIDRVGV